MTDPVKNKEVTLDKLHALFGVDASVPVKVTVRKKSTSLSKDGQTLEVDTNVVAGQTLAVGEYTLIVNDEIAVATPVPAAAKQSCTSMDRLY